ncbi:MAG: hypothetical protein HZA22_04505 [Nitrospirae bacterium]|nr:hypothetical protein [Nitrospirota bacterium]
MPDDECPSCGVLVSKFLAAQERRRAEGAGKQAEEESVRPIFEEVRVPPELQKEIKKTTRSCPYCYSEMDQRASVCPTCKKSSISPHSLQISGVVVLTIGVIIALLTSTKLLILAVVIWVVTLFGTLYAILARRSTKVKTGVGYTFAALTALLVLVAVFQKGSNNTSGSSSNKSSPSPPTQTTPTAVAVPEFEISTKEASSVYWAKLQDNGIAPDLVAAVAPGIIEGQIKIQVTNGWHYQPKQIRLQAAQNLWNLWVNVQRPTDADHARISIVDLNGNEVGGSRVLGGSLIWVAD